MKQLRAYLDTSVLGGCFDAEFAEPSLRLIEMVRQGEVVALISSIVVRELAQAPEEVRELLLSLPGERVIELTDLQEVEELTAAYLDAQVVSRRFAGDAAHIAFATVYRADVLVSWNFRHIVNLRRIRQFNAVNLLNGYHPLEIRSPRELTS